jgi:hypothetical protein
MTENPARNRNQSALSQGNMLSVLAILVMSLTAPAHAQSQSVPNDKEVTTEGGANQTDQFNNAIVAGTYAFRFDGNSMITLAAGAAPIPYYLVGLGLIRLDGNGNVIAGKQTSSTTPLSGANASLLLCEYQLSGTYQINGDGTGTATITFKPTTSGCAAEGGDFSLVLTKPDGDSFWLISTGATFVGNPAFTPDEVVQVEAVRLNK